MQISKMAKGRICTKSATCAVAEMRAANDFIQKLNHRITAYLSDVSFIANWQCEPAVLESS